MNNARPKENNDFILRMLLKENQMLKNAVKDKKISNDTTNTLLSILELQREKISALEDGNYLNLIRKKI